MIDLPALLALANAASGGKWLVIDMRPAKETLTISVDTPMRAICRIRNEVSKRPLSEEDAANAAFIAAANPETVKALLARLRAAEAVCTAALRYQGNWTPESMMLSGDEFNARLKDWRRASEADREVPGT